MTRTNRSMSEPPAILPDDLPSAGMDDLGGMVMLSACIIAGMVLTFIVAIGWGVHHQLVGRIDRLQADLKALQTFASCDAPKRPGDATVITYRRNEHTVAARCQVITNPLDPERALK